MATFSATAPAFSDADERAEREALTEHERLQVTQDVYFSSSDLLLAANGDNRTTRAAAAPEEMRRTSLAMLDEAIDAMALPAKAQYLEALATAPELVQRESSPAAYLIAEQYDPWAAAERLVGYWTLRRQLFGPDRAFLPMTLDQAMDEDGDALVKYAFALPLVDDQYGRPVPLWDRIRASAVSREVALRCLFYLMQTISQRPDFTTKGFVALINYQGCDLRKHFDRRVTKLVVAIAGAFPGKLRAVHFCSGPGRSVLGILLPVLKQLMSREYRLRLVVQSGSASDLLARFPDYGLGVEHVEALYGITNNKRIEIANDWIKLQRIKENKWCSNQPAAPQEEEEDSSSPSSPTVHGF